MRAITASGLPSGSHLPESAGKMSIAVRLDLLEPAPRRQVQELHPVQLRALALWPRLNRRALRRCGDDPARIAAFVSHRTRLPLKEIETLLTRT
jgi:hypothetical protein